MDSLIEWLVSASVIIGGVFALVGSIGLARLPDFYTRLHGPTKATTRCPAAPPQEKPSDRKSSMRRQRR